VRPVGRICLLGALLVGSAAVSLVAAQLTTTAISGTLTDTTGATVPDAAVTGVETSTGATARASANSEGFYVLSGLAPGQYRLRIEKDGFQAQVQEKLVLEVNRPVT
jgi:carboxypeptidase family protein